MLAWMRSSGFLFSYTYYVAALPFGQKPKSSRIFQGNPNDYDIDSYLASRPAEVVWLVTRYADEITMGDRIYLWRNQGQQKSVAGIIAEAIITVPPTLREEDPDGIRFWRSQGPRATAPQVRAGMRLAKVATSREVIRRDWCINDPVLRDIPNLRMQAATNYAVTPQQARRLGALWSRTGRDWNRTSPLPACGSIRRPSGKQYRRRPARPLPTWRS